VPLDNVAVISFVVEHGWRAAVRATGVFAEEVQGHGKPPFGLRVCLGCARLDAQKAVLTVGAGRSASGTALPKRRRYPALQVGVGKLLRCGCQHPQIGEDDPVPSETFGQAVRRLRKEQDTSLCKLAAKAPVDKGHLSKIENGRRSCTLALARALDSALDAGGQLVAIANAEQANRVRAAVPFDPMKRRTLVTWGLTASAAAGLGPSGAGLTLENVRHGLTLAAAEERAGAALD